MTTDWRQSLVLSLFLMLLVVAGCSRADVETWEVPSRAPIPHVTGGMFTYRNLYLLGATTTRSEDVVGGGVALLVSPTPAASAGNVAAGAAVRVFFDPDTALRAAQEGSSPTALMPYAPEDFAGAEPYSALALPGCEVWLSHSYGYSDDYGYDNFPVLIARCSDNQTLLDISTASENTQTRQPDYNIALAAAEIKDIYAVLIAQPNATLIANPELCSNDRECRYYNAHYYACNVSVANIYANLTDEILRPARLDICAPDYMRPRCKAHSCTQEPDCEWLLSDTDTWDAVCDPENIRAERGQRGDLEGACAVYAHCLVGRSHTPNIAGDQPPMYVVRS